MPPSAPLAPATAARLWAAAADPTWFATHVLGQDLWPLQRHILQALTRPQARVAVKACHASGKTHVAACAVLWWVATGGLALTTAPTWTQVRRVLWGTLHRLYARSRVPLGGVLLQTEWRLGPHQYALGLSTNEGVNFQGFHGRVLVVLDEAPGVAPAIWEAVEGIRAGGDVRVLAIGNPTTPTGPFAAAFGAQRAGWQPFTIDAFATPNLAGLALPELLALPPAALDANPRPYLVTRRWVVEKFHEWGEASPLWQARVRGQFPAQADDALYPLAWLEAAQARVAAPPADAPWEAGLDVAGPGADETVLAVRHGDQLVALHAWATPDPRGAVLAALAPYRARLAALKVDSVGLGYYFARHLEQHGWAGRVVDVQAGAPAADPERFANRKAELYWAFRARLEAGAVAGLTDDRLLAQLASIRYQYTPRGQLAIEDKLARRARGLPSPDRAEAVLLAYYTPPGRRRWGVL